MKLTIWQFILLVLIIVGLYVAYNYWWVYQDRKSWADKFSNWIFNSEEESDKSKPEPSPATFDG